MSEIRRPEDETEIEVTREMILAGADVLWNETNLDVGPSGAEALAERIIRRALKAFRDRKNLETSAQK